jgi:hypothetical protein
VEEEIYMEQIPGYEDSTNRVLRIVGSLYGLKQAPRIWNKTFTQKVLVISYKQMAANPSLFFWEQNRKTSILAVYVDDIAIFVTCRFANEVVKELMKLFEMRDLGELKDFLGNKITHNRQEMTITIPQDRHVRREFSTQRFSTSPGRESCDARVSASARSPKKPRVLPKNLRDSLHLNAHLPAEFPQVFSQGRGGFAEHICSKSVSHSF